MAYPCPWPIRPARARPGPARAGRTAKRGVEFGATQRHGPRKVVRVLARSAVARQRGPPASTALPWALPTRTRCSPSASALAVAHAHGGGGGRPSLPFPCGAACWGLGAGGASGARQSGGPGRKARAAGPQGEGDQAIYLFSLPCDSARLPIHLITLNDGHGWQASATRGTSALAALELPRAEGRTKDKDLTWPVKASYSLATVVFRNGIEVAKKRGGLGWGQSQQSTVLVL